MENSRKVIHARLIFCTSSKIKRSNVDVTSPLSAMTDNEQTSKLVPVYRWSTSPTCTVTSLLVGNRKGLRPVKKLDVGLLVVMI